MDWSPYLESGDKVRWEGRPAPRCYTLRNWKHSIFGFVLLLMSAFWLGVGLQLDVGDVWAWLPLPFALGGLYLSVGHLLWSRLQWEGVFYAITDRRIIVHKILPKRIHIRALGNVTAFQVRPFSANLGTMKVWTKDREAPLILACIEHPEKPGDLLRGVIEPQAQ